MRRHRSHTGIALSVVTALSLLTAPLTALAATTAPGATVSVTSYGARGDGVTDDTAAFRSAIGAAANTTLYVPAGTYRVSPLVVSSTMEIVGAGSDVSVLRRATPGTSGSLITVTAKNVALRDLGIDGASGVAVTPGDTPVDGTPNCVRYSGATDGVVERCRIVESGGINAQDGSDRMLVKDSTFYHNENDVLFFSSSYCTATGNVCQLTEDEAFASYTMAGATIASHDNTFENNRVTGAWCGITYQRSSNNIARNNTLTGCCRGLMLHNESGVAANARNNTFSDNTITGSTSSEAVLMTEPMYGLRFVNNTISQPGRTAILVFGDVHQAAIVNNTISGDLYCVGTSVFTDSVLLGDRISGNVHLHPTPSLAVTGTVVTGSAAWPAATAGTIADIGLPAVAGATRFKCTTAGAPGRWVAANSATPPPAPAPAPAPVPTSGQRNRVRRVSGATRYLTAVRISANSFAAADTVVLATGADFADALAASSYAGALQAPLLITPKGSLPAEVGAEIDRLGASRVIVCGSWSAISSGVEATLRAKGLAVERVSGPNRYATATALARRTVAMGDETATDTVFVTRGDAFADALSVSPLAYRRTVPVLLVRPGSVPAETLQALRDLAPREIVIVGGTSAVSPGIEATLRDMASSVTRVDGPNRYATSAAMAEHAVSHGWVTADTVGLASGGRFPDALGGGPACGSTSGVLLLTAPTALSGETEAFLRQHAVGSTSVSVFGGDAAVQTSVDDAVALTLPE